LPVNVSRTITNKTAARIFIVPPQLFQFEPQNFPIVDVKSLEYGACAEMGQVRDQILVDKMTDRVGIASLWVGIGGLVVAILGVVYAFWSDRKRKSERKWVHLALVNLKPAIQGSNKNEVIDAINDMLEFLKPPTK
jgi:hypothetical protein